MNENLPNIENTKARVEIATPADWQEFKNLTLEAYTSKDSWKFGITESNKDKRLENENAMGEIEWEKELSGKNFGVLSRVKDEAVGMGLVERREDGLGYWFFHSGYLKEKYRGQGIGQEMFVRRLKEILRRGGGKVVLAVKAANKESISLAEKFGFEKPADYQSEEGFFMELKNVSNPDLISKINEALDER